MCMCVELRPLLTDSVVLSFFLRQLCAISVHFGLPAGQSCCGYLGKARNILNLHVGTTKLAFSRFSSLYNLLPSIFFLQWVLLNCCYLSFEKLWVCQILN